MNSNPAWNDDKTNQSEELLSERFEKFWQRMSPVSTDLSSYWDLFTQQLEIENKKLSLNYYDYILKSGFQPIYSITHRRPVGYEALIRPYKSLQTASPAEVFTNAVHAGVSGDLDIICHTLHSYNFKQITQQNNNQWLFLNIIPSSILHYSVGVMSFEEILNRSGVNADQIVIEILENDITNDPRIDDAIDYFKQLGCKIAIDDFGAGHSNFERLWRLEPDMVKLDRSIITRTTNGDGLNFSLSKLVALLHEAGSLVIAEGIETQEEALVSLDADVDLVQGYYFAKPFLADEDSQLDDNKCEYLHGLFRKKVEEETENTNLNIMPYVNYLNSFLSVVKAGVKIDNRIVANKDILKSQGLENLLRIYMIDDEGYQIDANINISSSSANSNRKLSPLTNTSNSNWYYRPYFRKAISSPDTIQCSGPYLSVTDAAMCLTLSVAVTVNGKLMVVCCDIDWSNSNSSSSNINFTPKTLLS